MKAATKLNLLKERVADSETAEKAREIGSDVGTTVCNIAGYAAWRFGKLLRLGKLRDAIKADVQKYHDELNPEG